MSEAKMKEAALEYAKQGLRVFPLSPNSKIPLPGTKGCKDATSSVEAVAAYWDAFPTANIGIATGGGLFVLDVDNKPGAFDAFHTHLSPLIPKISHTVFTPNNGMHFYFISEREIRNAQGIVLNGKRVPGIDIRGEGGYVVAPPSSINGKAYFGNTCLLSEAPAELLSMLMSHTTSKPQAMMPHTTSEEKGQLAKSTLQFIAEGTPPGTWHAVFYKAAMDMKQNNYSYEEARVLLEKATGHLDNTDEKQLLDVYENRQPKHPPRIIEQYEGIDEQYNMANEPITKLKEGIVTKGWEPTASLIVTAASLAEEALSYMSDKELVKGTPTLVDGLDKLLGGGKRTGELTVWLAEAKTGKNTVWHQLMYNWLEAGIPIAYASRELTPATEVVPNILSIAFGENAWKAELTEAKKEKYKKALASWQLYFARGYGLFPISELKRWASELQEMGIKHFWIDHLHYCLEDSEDFKKAAAFARDLKTLTKEMDIHIDLIVQPTKIMEGQRLGLNTMRGGAAIGQALDNLFILERLKGDSYPANTSKLTLDVARHKLCNPGSIYFSYDKETTRLQEIELIEQPMSQPPITPYNPATTFRGQIF